MVKSGMIVREAQNILGVTRQEDDRAVKTKFRKLMALYHPDAAGAESPEVLRRAQLINEAYSILCKRAEAGKTGLREKTDSREEQGWKGKIIENAFAERVIYRSLLLWEEQEKSYERAAKGKYEWDPDLEEFDCLLKSVNQAAVELLENAERQNGFCREDGSGWQEARFTYQARLFHLLARQFIRPVSCLHKLARPEEIDGQGRAVYRFRGFLGCKGSGRARDAMVSLKKGDLLKVVSLRDNRMMISREDGTPLGHLSLAEDRWYYVVIPILESRLAQVKFIVADVEINKKRRPYQARVNVDLFLRMEKAAETETVCDRNQEIQDILDEYALWCGKAKEQSNFRERF